MLVIGRGMRRAVRARASYSLAAGCAERPLSTLLLEASLAPSLQIMALPQIATDERLDARMVVTQPDPSGCYPMVVIHPNAYLGCYPDGRHPPLQFFELELLPSHTRDDV